MRRNFRLKLRIITWIGLAAVALALLYCNLYSIATGSMSNIGTTSGWPFIYWTETTIVQVSGGVPTSIEVVTNIHWAAIAFNLLVAMGLLAGTGLTIERFLRPGATGQFTLGAIFNLVTIVAIAFGLRAIEPILFGHGVWFDPGFAADRDMADHLDLAPPWPIRVILLVSIAATILQGVRSIVWAVWFGTRRKISPNQSSPDPVKQ